jgi:hypothetical protein
MRGHALELLVQLVVELQHRAAQLAHNLPRAARVSPPRHFYLRAGAFSHGVSILCEGLRDTGPSGDGSVGMGRDVRPLCTGRERDARPICTGVAIGTAGRGTGLVEVDIGDVGRALANGLLGQARVLLLPRD